MSKKEKAANAQGSFSSTASKAGSKSLAAAAVVLAVIIAVNFLVSLLPEKFTAFDLSMNNMFDITDESIKIVSALKDDVTLYSVCTPGAEDKSISLVLNKYAEASPHIKIKKIDQNENPSFASKFGVENLDDNSVVVSCGDRSRVLTSNDLLDIEINYNTYEYQATGICAENAITNAIDYVTGAEITKIGFINGHDEISLEELDPEFTRALSSSNYEFEALSLVSKKEIPKDINTLAIISPQKDLSTSDIDAIKAFLKKGGKLMLCTDLIKKDEFPNIYAFLGGYGIEPVDGIVFESDLERCVQSYAYILPFINNHAVTAGLEESYVLFPGTQGFNISEELDESILCESLLETSEGAFSATDYENKTMPEYQEELGDIKSDGGFSVGAAITDTSSDTDEPGRIVYFSSSSFINSQASQTVYGSNETLFVNAFNWMCSKEDRVSIPSKSLMPETLLISEAASSVLTVIMVVFIPAAILIAGIVIFVIRRKH